MHSIQSLGLKHLALQKHLNLEAGPANLSKRFHVSFHIFLVSKWLNRLAHDSSFKLTGETMLQKIHRCPHTSMFVFFAPERKIWGFNCWNLVGGLSVYFGGSRKSVFDSLFCSCLVWILFLEPKIFSRISLCLERILSLQINEFLLISLFK